MLSSTHNFTPFLLPPTAYHHPPISPDAHLSVPLPISPSPHHQSLGVQRRCNTSFLCTIATKNMKEWCPHLSPVIYCLVRPLSPVSAKVSFTVKNITFPRRDKEDVIIRVTEWNMDALFNPLLTRKITMIWCFDRRCTSRAKCGQTESEKCCKAWNHFCHIVVLWVSC